jgi:tRNA (guanine-N7-)-methyltransferase
MAHDPVFVPTNYFRILDLSGAFVRGDLPLEIDLGCGDGAFLEQMAALHPNRNFLGVERMLGRVDKTARRIKERKLTNARVLRLESAYVLAWLLPPKRISRVHVLCPDPWPKKNHHKRRLFNNEEFLNGLERVLAPGGELLLKSDDPLYYENALGVMSTRHAFERIEWPEDVFPYPRTTFEEDWMAEGKTIHRVRWRLVG